ncbi:hypothetical protein Trco_008048 [Trichoderma cornu-damae]|uniref:Uncharacterized protein n=1 Tax=Trichoderma cornu-damae TaxID=654480 RepID=A0A9P8QI05_9HYPO|nr:hypothetical protein Trco_008048 [Trichoderma cornu-damae]
MVHCSTEGEAVDKIFVVFPGDSWQSTRRFCLSSLDLDVDLNLDLPQRPRGGHGQDAIFATAGSSFEFQPEHLFHIKRRSETAGRQQRAETSRAAWPAIPAALREILEADI